MITDLQARAIIRQRSASPASNLRALAEYVRASDKAIDIRLSPALLSERSAIAEMRGLAECARAHRPILHIVISWAPESQISIEQSFTYTERFLKHANLANGLCIAAAHGDARCQHVHVLAVNAHPRSKERLITKPLRILVADFGNRGPAAPHGTVLSAAARDAETWNGSRSFEGFVRGLVAGANPPSVAALDDLLAGHGILRRARRGGHVFVDATAPDPTAVRASRVGLPATLRHALQSALPPASLPQSRPFLAYWELVAAGKLPSPELAGEQAVRAEWEARKRRGERVGQLGRYVRRVARRHAPAGSGLEYHLRMVARYPCPPKALEDAEVAQGPSRRLFASTYELAPCAHRLQADRATDLDQPQKRLFDLADDWTDELDALPFELADDLEWEHGQDVLADREPTR